MNEKERAHAEQVIKAGEAVLKAGQELLDYLEYVETVLDTKQDTLTRTSLMFMKARCNNMKTKWNIQVFDYYVMRGFTAEEISRKLSRKKKTQKEKVAA